MITYEFKANEMNVHAYHGKKIADIASSFSCEITILYKRKKVDAKSMMGVISLGNISGDVIVTFNGEDENEAMEKIKEVIALAILNE